MVKKNWEQPQLLGLGLESTKEDIGTLEGEKVIFPCKYCGERFWVKKERDKHQETCFSKPAGPGLGEDSAEIPGLIPMS